MFFSCVLDRLNLSIIILYLAIVFWFSNGNKSSLLKKIRIENGTFKNNLRKKLINLEPTIGSW